MPQFLHGQRKYSASLTSVMRYCLLAPRQQCVLLILPGCQQLCVLQGIEEAKEKGMDELLAKRGRLKVQLEKVFHRIEEFPYYSELDMTEQVSINLACLENWVLGDIRSVSYKVYLHIITVYECNCTLFNFVWAVFS